MAGMVDSNDGEMASWNEQALLSKPPPTLALQSQVYYYYRWSSSAKIRAKRSNVPAVRYPSHETQRYLVRALVARKKEEKGIATQRGPGDQEMASEQRG